jgi:hypothetical protein
VERSLDDFSRDKSKASGRKSLCRACDNAKAKRYYEVNHEVITARVIERAKTRPLRGCHHCGATGLAPRRRFCDACRVELADRRKLARSAGTGWAGFVPEVRSCAGCGVGFVGRAPHAAYCSTSCRDRHRLTMGLKEKYDAEHYRLRKQWEPEVDAGIVGCARCGIVIEPGTPWDLDHTDDRSGYLGPSHASCNRRAPSLKAKRASTSRPW